MKAPTLHFTLFPNRNNRLSLDVCLIHRNGSGVLSDHQQRREHGLAAENPPHSLFQPQNLQPDFAQKAPPPQDPPHPRLAAQSDNQ